MRQKHRNTILACGLFRFVRAIHIHSKERQNRQLFEPYRCKRKRSIFQATATEFYIKTSAGQYLFLEDKANEGTYIGSTHDWNATTDFSLWTMGEADENGYVYLTRFNDSSQHLGNTRVSNAGTGVFTNVPLSNSDGNCNKWLIEGTMACPTTAEAQNGKMHFTSGSFAYEGVCNKLRFTLTESGAFYQNGAKRLSLDSLYFTMPMAVRLH